MYVYGVRSASHVTVTWQHANHSCIYIHTYIHMYVRTKGLGKESEAVVSYVKVCQMLKVTNSFRQLHQPVLWEVKHPEVLQVGDALHTTDRQEQEPCTHVHIRTYVCTYIHKEDSVIMNLSTYVRMYMDRYLYTVHTILCMYMYTYVHTYIHAYSIHVHRQCVQTNSEATDIRSMLILKCLPDSRNLCYLVKWAKPVRPHQTEPSVPVGHLWPPPTPSKLKLATRHN